MADLEKYTLPELHNLLYEYVVDPANHEGCQYKKVEDRYLAKCCSCELYSHVEQYLLWLKYKNLMEEIK